MKGGRRLLALLAAAALGCADGLSFTADTRLRFLAPPQRSEVETPLEVRWSFREPLPARYAVFVDRPPMRPGDGLAALAEDDPLCRDRAGCPDAEWLLRHRIHLTSRPAVRIPGLPADEGRRVAGRRLHDVTVVALGADGRRQGEGAWTLRVFGSEEDDP